MHERAHIHKTTRGQHAADHIARAMGSWAFIVAQSCIVAAWITCNIVGFIAHWDPFPFILLNLLFSTQAAYTAPVIMMSQNRQSEKDRLRDDHEAEEVRLLFKMNRQQLEILHLLRARVAPQEAPQEEERALAEEVARTAAQEAAISDALREQD